MTCLLWPPISAAASLESTMACDGVRARAGGGSEGPPGATSDLDSAGGRRPAWERRSECSSGLSVTPPDAGRW